MALSPVIPDPRPPVGLRCEMVSGGMCGETIAETESARQREVARLAYLSTDTKPDAKLQVEDPACTVCQPILNLSRF